MTDWCILRTSGRDTLRLAATLADDGFDVWTPVETKTIRIPRANVKRQIRLPIMPSYVFARAFQLIDLLQLADMPVKPRRAGNLPSHAGFSVLHAFGRIPMVEDRHLNGLRTLEAKRTPTPRATWVPAKESSVRVNGGVFGGLVGTVVRGNAGTTVLRFSHGFPVELPTCLLTIEELYIRQREPRKAA